MGGGGEGSSDGGAGFVTDGIEVKKADGGGDAVAINIRCSSGTKFAVQVSLESSVESFKSVLAQNCDIPAEQQRLIYKGRILKDDQTLKSYGLEAEHTVHLVRGFVPAASNNSAGTATTRAPSITPSVARGVGSIEEGMMGGAGASLFSTLGLNGLGGNGGMSGAGLPELEQIQQQLTQNPNMMRDIMDMPLVQNLMNNPDVIRNMMMSNPQMRDIIDRNPELAHMLNDPAILRQTMEAARNPELMREMMRNTDRAMSNIESSPEGFNMLRRMYENVQEPFLNATTMGGDTRNDLSSNPFAALLGAQGGHNQLNSPTTAAAETTTGSPAPNTNPLPNPWAAAAAAGGGGGGAGANQTNATATHPAGTDRSTPPVGLGGLGIPGLEGILGSTPDPNAMSQLMQNPAISQMMQSLLSNPQYMNQMLGVNSQMLNPQLREMMQNPDFIRQMTSPETMQQMMALQQSLFSQLGRQQNTGDVGQTGGGTAGAPANIGLDMLRNMFNGLGTGGFTTPNNSNVPPEERYATQLAQLQEMGFFDTRENLQALAATAGNVHAAVERLLGNPGQ